MFGEENSDLCRWVSPHSAVILGLSGGGDSVYLLHALCALRREHEFPMLAVHIHHGLRGSAADDDERFSRALCGMLEVPFLSEHADVRAYAAEKGLTIEQAGREVRYEVFYREARRILKESAKCDAAHIFLAHHANDQEETVLMNLLRGSGVSGLSGMKQCTEVFRTDGKPVRLIRPLLGMTHEEILASLSRRGLKWCEDATNQELDYTRNRLRGEVLPKIRELSPGFTRICGREAALFGELDDYMEQEAERVLAAHMSARDGLALVPAAVLSELHPALRHAVIRRCIGRVCGLKDVCTAHIDAAEALLHTQSGRRVCLPKNASVCREFDNLCFMTGGAKPCGAQDMSLSWEVCAQNGAEFLKNLKKSDIQCYTKCLDYDKIKEYCGDGAPVLRTPLDGDYLLINRQGQKKRLALYLKQEKIPERLRSQTPVVAWGNIILWVIGHRDSAYFFVTEKTEKILRLRVSGEE